MQRSLKTEEGDPKTGNEKRCARGWRFARADFYHISFQMCFQAKKRAWKACLPVSAVTDNIREKKTRARWCCGVAKKKYP